MNTPNEVINDWRERRDLTLAVKERVEHQLRALNVEIVPGKSPDAEQAQRLEDLQFELGLLQEAYKHAEQQYQAHSLGSEPTGPSKKGEEDNG